MRYFSARCQSIRCAASGILHLVRTQRNAWIHLAATATVITLSARLHLTVPEWCWLILAIGAVWIAEALNTALELLADAAVPEWHQLVGRAKDVAAGGVLLAAVTASAIGACILGPRLL
jgi:diacylglycerol kinase (ATP)